MKKLTTTLAGLALTASVLSACGAGVPTDASEKDFCSGFEDFIGSLAETGTDDTEAQIKAVREGAEKLRETGVPEDAPDDAVEGFDVTTQTLVDIEDDASLDDLDKLDEDFSEDEKNASDAFEEYLETTCEV